jgi:hypothetical protein
MGQQHHQQLQQHAVQACTTTLPAVDCCNMLHRYACASDVLPCVLPAACCNRRERCLR